MAKNITALVPIKKHSERVPRKNFQDFNGRPLYHWVLNTLQSTNIVNEILVDTDSERVLSEAPNEFDVTVVERPERLRGDNVSMNRIILHDVTKTDNTIFLQTHCTNPLLRPETIDKAGQVFLEDNKHDSLFSATKLHTRLWIADIEPLNHKRDELERTQDLPPVYEENSNMYFFSQSSVESRENRIGDDPITFEMDEREAIDIDEPVDFERAEFLHRRRYGENPSLTDVIQADLEESNSA
jgi:CMP-N-acetylneuraminic acid synthetase